MIFFLASWHGFTSVKQRGGETSCSLCLNARVRCQVQYDLTQQWCHFLLCSEGNAGVRRFQPLDGSKSRIFNVCVLTVSWWFCLLQQLTAPISCLLLKVFWWNHLLCFCRSRLQFQEKMSQLTSPHSALNHRHSNLFFVCLFLFVKAGIKTSLESGSHWFGGGFYLFLCVMTEDRSLWFIVKQSPHRQTQKHVVVISFNTHIN